MAAATARAAARGRRSERSAAAPPGDGPIDLRGYLVRSRRVSLSLVYVAVLFFLYEALIRLVDSRTRNAAEVMFKELFLDLGPGAIWLELFLAGVFAFAVWRVVRDRQPALRLFPPFLVECLLLALLLGPVVNALTGTFPLQAVAPGGEGRPLAGSLLASVGAGVYEELLFRLLLLGGGYTALLAVLGARKRTAFAVALVASSLAFATYHHVGANADPWESRLFVFRALAGILLGLVFAFRGLGVVVYLHALYDVLVDLRVAAWD